MTHILKVNPTCFSAKINGTKTFEIRDNSDRFFQNGDKVVECEVVRNGSGDFVTTGRSLKYMIGFISTFKQKEDYVVFSCLNVEEIYETESKKAIEDIPF